MTTATANPWLTGLRRRRPCTDGLAWAREHDITSVADGWARLERADWMIWLAEAYKIDLPLPALREWSVDCAEHVLPAFEARYPTDPRPRDCIAVTRRYLRGDATVEEVRAYADAADAAATAAYTAATAAYAAAYAYADERQWQADHLRALIPTIGAA